MDIYSDGYVILARPTDKYFIELYNLPIRALDMQTDIQ